MKKKNLAKKIFALLLAGCLVVALAACGSDSSSSESSSDDSADASEDEETEAETSAVELTDWTIGYNIFGSGDVVFDYMVYEMEYAFETLGVSYNYASDNYSTDTALQNAQNFVSAGVDGAVLQANDASMVYNISEIANDGEMPFVLSIFVGDDETRAEVAADMEYYIGSVQPNIYLDGYNMGLAALEDGMETVVLIGGSIGDYHIEQRLEGFTQSFVTEGGGTILEVARCASPSETTEKATALISAYSETDCIYVMSSSFLSGTLSAMEQLGYDYPLYVSNGDSETAELVLSGDVRIAGVGNDLAETLAIALMVNYLDGYQILDEDGNVPELEIVPFMITEEDAELYIEIFHTDGSHPFTEELLQSFAYRYNSDVTYEDFYTFATEGINLESFAEWAGLS